MPTLNDRKRTKEEKKQLEMIVQQVNERYLPMVKQFQETDKKLQKQLVQPFIQIAEKIAKHQIEVVENLTSTIDFSKFLKSATQLPQQSARNLGGEWVRVDIQRRVEKDRLRKLQIQKLEKELATDQTLPEYDIVDCVIRFQDVKIQIPPDTNMEMVCKVVLRNKQSMLRIWNWDEVVETWGDDPKPSDRSKIYTAGRGINDKVAMKTTYEDFLDVTTKTIRLNPDLLPENLANFS